MNRIKRLFIRLYDLPNAFRVLDIMDSCGVDIYQVDYSDKWDIKPKWYLTENEAKDLRTIVLCNEDYRKRSKLWRKLIFRNLRDGYRPM